MTKDERIDLLMREIADLRDRVRTLEDAHNPYRILGDPSVGVTIQTLPWNIQYSERELPPRESRPGGY